MQGKQEKQRKLQKKEKFKTPRRDQKRPKASKKVKKNAKKHLKASKIMQKQPKWSNKNQVLFLQMFSDVSFCFENNFHTCNGTSLIFVPTPCGKYIRGIALSKAWKNIARKIQELPKHCKKHHKQFLLCYKIQNFIRTSWALIITTFHINF